MQIFQYLIDKYSANSKQSVNMIMPVCSMTEYKGAIGYVLMTTFIDDAKLIYGYNSAQDMFANELTAYPNALKMVYKELASIFRTKEMEYNMENKVIRC